MLRPHHFIFNREWYERLSGKPEFEQYARETSKLTSAERSGLLSLISSCDPHLFSRLLDKSENAHIKTVLRYYVPLPKDKEAEIWSNQVKALKAPVSEIPDDERVEDAGLSEETPIPLTHALSKKPQREMVLA